VDHRNVLDWKSFSLSSPNNISIEELKEKHQISTTAALNDPLSFDCSEEDESKFKEKDSFSFFGELCPVMFFLFLHHGFYNVSRPVQSQGNGNGTNDEDNETGVDKSDRLKRFFPALLCQLKGVNHRKVNITPLNGGVCLERNINEAGGLKFKVDETSHGGKKPMNNTSLGYGVDHVNFSVFDYHFHFYTPLRVDEIKERDPKNFNEQIIKNVLSVESATTLSHKLGWSKLYGYSLELEEVLLFLHDFNINVKEYEKVCHKTWNSHQKASYLMLLGLIQVTEHFDNFGSFEGKKMSS
jgi:hypothetical protein